MLLCMLPAPAVLQSALCVVSVVWCVIFQLCGLIMSSYVCIIFDRSKCYSSCMSLNKCKRTVVYLCNIHGYITFMESRFLICDALIDMCTTRNKTAQRSSITLVACHKH
ncbi:hypothetical protein BS78_05G084600 [Paspalum vaginatum]|nr:hypothetical protein BS78_05G084600 [Paspalum vaginatum]